MGTRGITGFRQDGQDKVAYQQFDSYPSGVGVQVIQDVHELLKDKESFKKAINDLKIVSNKKPPTQEQIEQLKQFADLSVSNQKYEDWYCLLRETQGEPAKILKAGYVNDSSNFINDSLYCEYGYIINLDDNVVEFYKGFQKEKHNKGRYAENPHPDYSKSIQTNYYPCALIGTVPFDLIEQDPKAAQEMLEGFVEQEDDEEAA